MKKDERNPKPSQDMKHISFGFDELFANLSIVPDSPLPVVKGKQKQEQSYTALDSAAAEILAKSPLKSDLVFMATEMLQCTLPHRDPGDVPVWARTNGRLTLLIQPGYHEKTLKSFGLPHGSIARLILYFIVTEAIRTKSRVIYLGRSLNEFLRELGLDPSSGGGKFSDRKKVKDQIERISKSKWSLVWGQLDGSETRVNVDIAEASHYWWSHKTPDEDSLFQSQILLSEGFFNLITKNPVPADIRALKLLKKWPLALDLYWWVTWRLFVMELNGQDEISMPLQSLMEQFGSNYARLRDFKADLEKHLTHVAPFVPSLDYSITANRFTLRNKKKRLPVPAKNKELAKRRLQEMQPHKQITNKARLWFEKEYTIKGFSLEKAITDFNYWLETSPVEPRSADALFRTFVKKHWVQ